MSAVYFLFKRKSFTAVSKMLIFLLSGKKSRPFQLSLYLSKTLRIMTHFLPWATKTTPAMHYQYLTLR